MKIKTLITCLAMVVCYMTHAQSKPETATVKSYNGIQVFFNCKPARPFFSLGKIKGKAPVRRVSQAFQRYTSEAIDQYPSCTGIIIHDLNFSNDEYEVIRSLIPGGYQDTAVLTTNVFMSAKPVRAYETVRLDTAKISRGSLKSSVEGYYTALKARVPGVDGVIIDDVDFGMGSDVAVAFRWKKVVAPPAKKPSKGTAGKPAASPAKKTTPPAAAKAKTGK
jgi:hypothetical protein